jgi:hypothetical protein
MLTRWHESQSAIAEFGFSATLGEEAAVELV